MLFSYPTAAVVLQIASLASAVELSAGLRASEQKVVPGAYIVTFDASLPSADEFYRNLTANGILVTPRQTFDPAVFAGTSFKLHDVNSTHLDTIGSFAQVTSISPVTLHDRVTPVGEKAHVAKLGNAGATTLKGRASASPPAHSGTQTSHIMTGVDRLHAEGLDGTGMIIAMVDSGVDYTLAALGGGFGPGFKVARGHDFVGDYDANGNPAPDSDPMDCAGHGTHVAGIIGASNDPYVLGVAPNATLYSYKVFGCEASGGADDILISAFIMAHKDGADVITCSIGGDSPWPESPLSSAVAAVVARGTPCIFATGNSGEAGMFFTSAAAAGTGVTAVGSVDNTNTPSADVIFRYTTGGDATIEVPYNLEAGNFSGINLPVVANSLDSTVVSDACDPITKDLSGSIALIRRGICDFDVKIENALAAGAKYVLIYNNEPGEYDPYISDENVLGAAMISGVAGQELVKQLAAGHKIHADFGRHPLRKIITPGPANTLSGNAMSYFSSYGLSAENFVKPVISAPGGSILSTYLTTQGSYAVLSGTSMATPFVAGVVALYKQAKGKAISPKAINSALAATARPLHFNDRTKNSTSLASVAQQGSGLIDAYHFIHGSIVLSEPNLAFNDTANFVSSPSFYVENSGKKPQTYIITHAPAVNSYAFNASFGTPNNHVVAPDPEIDEKYSSVVISPSTLTLAPGAKKRISISVTPNASLNSTRVPVYSGFIKVTAADGEVASLPYAGVAAKMIDIPTLNPDYNTYDNSLADSVIPYSGPGKTPSGFIDFYNVSNYSYAQYTWANIMASRSIRLDIVSLNGTNPVIAAGLATVGSAVGFPFPWQGRQPSGYVFTTDFAGYMGDNASPLPSGVYKMVLRILKIFADPAKGSSYESSESPPFYLDMTNAP
ncbi:hypothetical protein WAI453_013211 [Rhynchosporium graminicola]